MATYLGTSAVFEVRSTATAGNLGGGGFNITNTHFPTDGVIAGGTGNTPTIAPTSSYAFVNNDAVVGAWVFFPVQTGVTYPTWAQISSVSGGVATLAAAVGQCIQIVNNSFIANTVAGIASSATPTLTYGIDYSQANSALVTNNVLTGTTTSCTDATTPFASNHIGNFICISTGTGVTAGWYEITNVAAGTATLDRTAGATYSSCTYYLGGAVSLGGSTTGITDVIFFALGAGATTSGCRFFIKNGSTYSVNGAITTLAGNASWPSRFEGYYTQRGDMPSIASGHQPVLNFTTSGSVASSNCQMWNMTFTTSTNSVNIFSTGVNTCWFLNCKFINKGVTAGFSAYADGGNSVLIACEFISYRGNGINIGGTGVTSIVGCYIHDCDTGISNTGPSNYICDNIISNCVTYALYSGAGGLGNIIYNNTIYGAENKLGVGINLPANAFAYNNILYGFVNGFGGTATRYGGIINYNCLYNNTNNIDAANTGIFLGDSGLTATNPSFTSVTQRTGTTATTTAGNHLVQSGATFVTWGVTAGVDCVYITSGTGVTAGIYGILSVDSETQITTDITLSANATANKVWSITQGHNFLPTGNV